MINIPDKAEISAIFKSEGVNENIINHGRTVADLSLEFGERLIKKGFEINLSLLEAAANLHDISKGKKNHAKAGADILRNYGYEEVAEIVENHMNLKTREINEKSILYIADKLIKENRRVTLKERFAPAFEKYKDDKKIYDIVRNKYQLALYLENIIEN